jgi:hypothetical protein
MTAARKQHSTKRRTKRKQTARPKATEALYVAFELSWNEWKLAFGTGPLENPRLKSVGGRDTQTLLREIAKAKKRLGLADDAPVHSCYEAGRDGFWLHRFLESQGINNVVVDSASIEVKRRGRRRKTDRLDAGKLLSMLIRWQQGEQKVWSVVQVPSVTDEDRRQLHRDPSCPFPSHWAHQDSNLEPRDYESPALPLSYGPPLPIGSLKMDSRRSP